MRVTSLKVVALVTAFAASAACGVKKQTTEISAGSVGRAATCEGAIVTYDTRSFVPGDYYELGWVEAEANSVWTTDNKLQENIRNGAAKLGATAVIINPVEQSKTTYKVLGEAVGASSATAKASALAIYVPMDAERVRQACGG
jgi:hypothetical protein